jgi:hypothetical protein
MARGNREQEASTLWALPVIAPDDVMRTERGVAPQLTLVIVPLPLPLATRREIEWAGLA